MDCAIAVTTVWGHSVSLKHVPMQIYDVNNFFVMFGAQKLPSGEMPFRPPVSHQLCVSFLSCLCVMFLVARDRSEVQTN